MPYMVKNLTRRPVLLRLNSGTTLHLGPGLESGELHDVDVVNNDKIEKLQGRGILSVEEVKSTRSSSSKSSKSKKASS